MTGAGAQHDGGTDNGGTDNIGEAQGGSEPTVNRVAVLGRRPGQVKVPAESREDISAHSFWKLGTTVMFDIRIFNLHVGSYLRMTPEKALAKSDN